MKYGFLLILILSSITAFGQETKTLELIKASEGYLLVLKEDSVYIDTLMSGSYRRLLDYVIKSENEIATIITDGNLTYSYFQFYKSDIYQFWTIDSSANWPVPSWVVHLKDPNNPNLRAKYTLKNFHTVLKTIDGIETVLDLQEQKTKHAQPVMYERELAYVIETLSDDSLKDWKSIDSVFRNHVVPTSSIRLRHLAFMLMIRKKQLLEKADIPTLNYYAQEIEKMDRHYDPKFYILFMKQLATYWPKDQVAKFAQNFFIKNSTYWESKFNSMYLEDSPDELTELKKLMRYN